MNKVNQNTSIEVFTEAELKPNTQYVLKSDYDDAINTITKMEEEITALKDRLLELRPMEGKMAEYHNLRGRYEELRHFMERLVPSRLNNWGEQI